PTTMPPEGRIYLLSLWPVPQENGGGGLAEYWGTGDMKWPMSINGAPLNAYRCQLTNYGSVPVFNVELNLHMLFREALRDADQPNVTRSGQVTLSRDWPVLIRKIDTGAEKPFIFYLYNVSNNFFVQISLPQSATLEQRTDGARRETHLI